MIEKRPLSSQPCEMRGCKNHAYLLYPLGGMKKKAICLTCLKKLMANYQDLKVKESQMIESFVTMRHERRKETWRDPM